ncbi:uncharacterized protein LOC113306256 [Papaver somniferum]|uniref:uncharacterized protein LOC113306256 n=1 Tax=Papaver somniferum TaxID=3469 RepID=UPI000E6F5C05|nr:uncharacterized protein LOC113306256 [Papaver somniferum]
MEKNSDLERRIENSGCWDYNLIFSLFDSTTAGYILDISIHHHCEDRLVWTLESNGAFSVKSAYRKMFEEKNITNTVGQRMNSIFKRLWKLPLTQFAWKCIRTFFLLKINLHTSLNQMIPAVLSVPLILKRALTASLNATLLKGFGLSLLVYKVYVDRLYKKLYVNWWIDFWRIRYKKLNYAKLLLLHGVRIWNERCDKTYKGRNVTTDSIIRRCRKDILDFENKLQSSRNSVPAQPRVGLHWCPPSRGIFKINCDGCFLLNDNTGGIGLILHDFAGGSKYIYLAKATGPVQAECKALWEACRWAKELNLEKVVFELDSKLVADAVVKTSFNVDCRIYNLVLDIRSLFSMFTSWKCLCVPKEKNKVADILSKSARVDRLCGVWLLDPPDYIIM